MVDNWHVLRSRFRAHTRGLWDSFLEDSKDWIYHNIGAIYSILVESKQDIQAPYTSPNLSLLFFRIHQLILFFLLRLFVVFFLVLLVFCCLFFDLLLLVLLLRILFLLLLLNKILKPSLEPETRGHKPLNSCAHSPNPISQ